MLSFSEYQIDQELSSLSEELQENFVKDLLDKLDSSKKKEIENHIIKVNNSRDPKELERHSKHPHFAVRLAVAKNRHTHPVTLKDLKSGSSEYKSVADAADKTLKSLGHA